MRIDLPTCNLKTCRYCFDGNCTDRKVRERCVYALTVYGKDIVLVVRCEDCRWYDKSTVSGTYEPIAFKCKLHQRFTLGNMFCSDGEKDDA